MPSVKDVIIGSVIAVPVFFFGTKIIKRLVDELKDRTDDDDDT